MTAMDEEDEKPRTLLVGNIPRDVHKREIEEVFGEIGPLKRCYIQYPRDDKKKAGSDANNNTLLAYVTYALSQDAVKALETLGNHKLKGTKIYVKFTKTRSEQVRPATDDSARREDRNKRRGERDRKERDEPNGNPNFITLKDDKKPKPPRPKQINKKSRLIIRNLSFRVTDEKLREYFGNCGEIQEVNILKKPDGKLVGCAFIQFNTVPQAAKAVRELNLKPFLGRPIAIDWALSKKDFQEDNAEVKAEVENEDQVKEEIEIKSEPEESEVEDEEEEEEEVKVSVKINSLKQEKVKERPIQKRKRTSSSEDEDVNDQDTKEAKVPKRSNDVGEGKTLFIRNLEFSATEEQLREFFESYGPLHYALLCRDSLTEYPKGTGFVKFNRADDANKVLVDFNVEPTKFKLGVRNFVVSLALPREEVQSKGHGKDDEKDKIKHDNRNLYLVREGFIRPESSAAEGVSASDMNKRASINSTKKQMLKNLSIFVSPTRMCVHNLPEKLSDKSLRQIFRKYSNPEARITEAKIMRNMSDIQLDGKGKSKGFGFVSYSEPEHALAALRHINNNPDIFTPSQRPIVEFSLENRKALQAKDKRREKSKEMNKNVPQTSKTESTLNNLKKKRNRPGKEAQQSSNTLKHAVKKNKGDNESHGPEFSGLTGKPGVSKLPVVKAKGKITRKSLKGSKNKRLQDRKVREPQIKPKRNLERPDNAEKLLTNYKKQLAAGEPKGRKNKKWYQNK